jgi:hypothetical protein
MQYCYILATTPFRNNLTDRPRGLMIEKNIFKVILVFVTNILSIFLLQF